jgi:hypothetical protein
MLASVRRWAPERLTMRCCPRRRAQEAAVALPTARDLVDDGAFKMAEGGYVSFESFKRELLRRVDAEAVAERALGAAGLRAVVELRPDPQGGHPVTTRWVVGLEAP